MFKLLILITLLNLSSCKNNITKSNIIQSNRFSDLNSITSTADSNTLVIFDIDNVIVVPSNTLLSTNFKEFIGYLKNAIQTKGYSYQDKEKIMSLVWYDYYGNKEKVNLVDLKTPKLINRLQKNGIKVMGLTAFNAEPYGYFTNLISTRINTLKGFNISFYSFGFKDVGASLSKDINFKNGILFASKISKGQALKIFLNNANYKPKKIIFIDDKYENIKSVQDFCTESDIIFKGIHYISSEENINQSFDAIKAKNELDKILKEHNNIKNKNISYESLSSQFLLNGLLTADPKDYDKPPVVDHIKWMKYIHDFLKNNEKSDISKVSHDNPMSHFDTRDAKEVLAPLLKKFFNYDLNNEVINRLFKKECEYYKDDSKKSSIKYFLQDKVKLDLYNNATKAYNIIKGNTVIILGQTPAYLGIMMDEIKKTNNDSITKIIFVPFSGRPDYIQKLKGKWNIKSSYLNLLSKNKELVFRQMLTERGFSSKNLLKSNQKIFILDNSSGPSFASFLAIICRWLYEENNTLPEITLLHASNQKDLFIQNDKNRWVNIEKLNLKMSDNLIFNFPVIFLDMDDKILRSFDKISDNLRIVPSSNSLYWRKNYHNLFKQYPTPEAKKLIQEYREYVDKKKKVHNN